MTLSHSFRRARRRRVGTALAAIVTVATAAAALSGCSANSSTADGSGTVSFLSWDTQKTMQPLIDEFEKENPGLTVEASYAPPVTEYIQKLQTQLSSNTAPDVFIITAENKHQLMDGGFVQDQTDKPWMSNLADASKQAYSKDGKVYGTAISSWGGGFLINKDLLAKVGYTSAPKTWDEFLDLGEKLKATGVTPLMEGGDGIPVSLAALVGVENAKTDGQMDQEIWDGSSSFADTWTAPLKAWNELFEKGIEPRTVAGLKGDQVMQEFEQGNVAIATTGSWGLGAVQQAAPNLNLDFIPVPSPSGTSFWAGAVSPGYAINAKAKNSEGASKFVEFLQSKTGVELYQKETQSITTTSDFTPTLDPALDTMATAVREGSFYLPQVNWPSKSDVMNTEATSLLQQAIAGTITPEQVAQGLDTKLQSVK